MSTQHTPSTLIPALRQYRHNNGDDGFVVAFDHDTTISAFTALQAKCDGLFDALLKYSEHKRQCHMLETGQLRDCNCGLGEALAKSRAKPKTITEVQEKKQ